MPILIDRLRYVNQIVRLTPQTGDGPGVDPLLYG